MQHVKAMQTMHATCCCAAVVGGGLAYANYISVTPGSEYTVTVGAPGKGTNSAGGDSFFINTGEVAGAGGNVGCYTCCQAGASLVALHGAAG